MEDSLPLSLLGKQPGENDEAALVAAAKVNAESFGEIYGRYVGRVYRYMRTRADTEEDAADLTHQVFLQALGALPNYQDRGLPFGAWLFRISHNVANERHRRRRATVPWETLPARLHPVDPQDCEREVLRRQELDRVRVLLRRLEPEEREVIALRFFAELTLAEIARVVNRSQASVQRQIVRVLATLKEHYNEE